MKTPNKTCLPHRLRLPHTLQALLRILRPPVRLREALTLCLWATASLAAQASQACPEGPELQAAQLVGTWRAQLPGPWGEATLVLAPHPKHAGSLAGHVQRGAARAQVVADLDDGEFTLEESSDGVHIDATWLGEPVEGRCGREIRGEIRLRGQDETDPPPRAFILRRP